MEQLYHIIRGTGMSRVESVISPLEGEMSPKATEGVGSTGRDLPRQVEVGALCETTPSGLPAICPSRGEINTLPSPLPLPSQAPFPSA
ncbi:hypothetical protein EN742_04395 [Mesorhizobium sp. M4A.F.Ca.ET.020.02.1.1]|nr:hypothetical protein EOA33_16805 [Mesorhizobium sp. M4A.F.Ca.ET.050.02.1.1]RVD43668.1 hypothetical protein EN742_04395 [Mesorhizobium sp. M4A.F.Ca.ET.020.02.1.1]RWD31218.1 MAG: hypothetical protein EOS22_05265 [Mesorhizobium sp.]TIW28107.1 MAG: hypothetical protein E5V63_06810 [Mesorhizobium sp.]